jgi:hypothetical protein
MPGSDTSSLFYALSSKEDAPSRGDLAILITQDIRLWSIATNSPEGSDVSFRDEAEVDRATGSAAQVEND